MGDVMLVTLAHKKSYTIRYCQDIKANFILHGMHESVAASGGTFQKGTSDGTSKMKVFV